MVHSVLISLASNYEQKSNLCEARKALAQILVSTDYTEEIWTEAVGKGRGYYLNQLVKACTELNSLQLSARLKEMELTLGRTDDDRQIGRVRIDLDLLEHDGVRFHLRDWERPYIQQLLKLYP